MLNQIGYGSERHQIRLSTTPEEPRLHRRGRAYDRAWDRINISRVRPHSGRSPFASALFQTKPVGSRVAVKNRWATLQPGLHDWRVDGVAKSDQRPPGTGSLQLDF